MEKTILIVDSNSINISIPKRILAKICKTIISAESGFVALEILKSQKVDLILVAIEMPIMSGLQLIEYLRQDNNCSQFNYYLRSVPIIATCSDFLHTSPHVNDSLLIPINKALLIQKVKNLLFIT